MSLPLKPKRLIQNGLVAHYAPIRQRNLLKWSEPLITNLGVKSATVTQANFTENGLSNGIQFPSNNLLEYAYLNFPYTLGKIYNFSVFVVMDDGGQPTVTNNTTSGDFCLVLSNGLASFNSVQHISGNLYRVNGSATISNANQSAGVVRYATQSGKGFRVTGYQLELSPSATTYQRTTDLQTVWNQKQENMSVTNIVQGGNFPIDSNSDGLADNWVISGTVTSKNVGNNIQSYTPSIQYTKLEQSGFPNYPNNKIYVCAKIKVGVDNAISLVIKDSFSETAILYGTSFNSFKFISCYKTINASSTQTRVYIEEKRVSSFTEIQVKEVLAIDLTSLFGAGNEPTTQQCDEMFSSWFDGSIRMNLNRYNGMLGSTSAVDTTDSIFDGLSLKYDGVDDFTLLPNITSQLY